MVQSEISGIAFSVHPVTEDPNQLIIEAGYGLGEAVVSGQITPDSYVVTKSPLEILDKNISTQERMLVRSATGGNEWVAVHEYTNNSNPSNTVSVQSTDQKLTDVQILELSRLIIKIENHYGFPCDIEWAFITDPEPGRGGQFYITQSRPITTLTLGSDSAV
jgi:pyruvate,water dikinase